MSLPILQVITDNDRRGGQVFASDLHEALEGLGESVRTVALAPAKNAGGLAFESLGPTRRHPETLLRLRRAIAGSSVVIGHGSTTLPMCAVATLGLDTPFIYRQISEQLFWANTAGRKLRTSVALRSATHVTALWRGAATVLTDEFSVPADRISIIPNGVPSGGFTPVSSAARREAKLRFGLDPDTPTLLSIGALVPEKGVDTLVQAMGHPSMASWQLLIVGAGPELQRLRQIAARETNSRVQFSPPVKKGSDAMAAADVLGLTSRGGDSMPAVLIEAGLMEIPVVATPIEGIVDIVLDRRSGRLVALDDPDATAEAIGEAYAQRDRLGPRARQHCLETFDISRVAPVWLRIIEDARH